MSDHFTPLSRAVASIERNDYAARFAVYDREYTSLLRRLAASPAPVSAADFAREEQAFHDAVRRVEFGEAEAPTLVPHDEPLAPVENSSARLRDLVTDATPAPKAEEPWPRPRPPRRDPVAVAGEMSAVAEPLVERRRRTVMRRVWERLAIAVLLFALFGIALLIGPKDGQREAAATKPAPVEQLTPAQRAADQQAARMGLPQLHQPSWVTPPMFYTPPPMPTAPAQPTPAQATPQAATPLPRNEVPLPVPRPEI
jgi:hypothetical protein